MLFHTYKRLYLYPVHRQVLQDACWLEGGRRCLARGQRAVFSGLGTGALPDIEKSQETVGRYKTGHRIKCQN